MKFDKVKPVRDQALVTLDVVKNLVQESGAPQVKIKAEKKATKTNFQNVQSSIGAMIRE